MIRGGIDARYATARVLLNLTDPLSSQEMTLVVDTCFYGAVLIPIEWAALMTQHFHPSPRGIYLADGTQCPANICTLEVTWVSSIRSVEAIAVQRPVS